MGGESHPMETNMFEQLLKDKHMLWEEDIVREIELGTNALYDSNNSITARAAVVKDTDDHHMLQIVIFDTRFSKDNPEIFAPKFACKHFSERDTTWLAQVLVGMFGRGISNANNASQKELKKRFNSLANMAGMKL